MTLASERAYFDGDHCQHLVTREDHQRHARIERQAARRGRHRWNEEPPARECEPCFTLDRQIAEWRAEVGEERYRQLQAEWGERRMKNEITFARQSRTAPRECFGGGHRYAGPIESVIDDYRRTVGPVRWQFVGVVGVCIAFALVLFGIGVVTP